MPVSYKLRKVSVRMTPDEFEMLEEMGFESISEALRHLIRQRGRHMEMEEFGNVDVSAIAAKIDNMAGCGARQ